MAVHYRPVLKARKGELDALADVAPSTWASMTPVLELVPHERRPIRDQCRVVRDRLAESWQDGMRLILDAGQAEPRDAATAGVVLADLWTEVRDVLAEVTPAVGLADEGALPRLRDAGALDRGLVLRLRSAELAAAPDALDRAVTAFLRPTGLGRSDVDLLVDLGPAPVDPAAPAGSVGPALSDRSWRSRTLVCGAFPRDLAGLPAMEVREVPRRDVRTWREVRGALGVAGRGLDFGDYAVAHPGPGPRGPYGPPPQLRYAVHDRWLVMKGRRGPATQFYEICRRIGSHPEFAVGLGAADAQIEQRGRHGPRSRLGCGNSATWRELSTAHHLEFVVREIQAEDARTA